MSFERLKEMTTPGADPALEWMKQLAHHLEASTFQVNFEVEGFDTVSLQSSISWAYGDGEMTITPHAEKISVKYSLIAENGEIDAEDATFPAPYDPKELAEAIDEMMGGRTHNLQDSDEDEDEDDEDY